MQQKFIRPFIALLFMLFILAGCADGTSEKQYSTEMNDLKKEIDVLKESISKNEQMQMEIDNLKKEIEQLKAKKDETLEASVYSCSINEEDIEVTIDFKKENNLDREISFIVLSGNVKNQRISGEHVVIRYDEVMIPGKGTVGTDDVLENVKRYRIVFPSRTDYVFFIIAFDKNTGSTWSYEINSSMQGDI
jgi:uncharacterized cupin superfamily protein